MLPYAKPGEVEIGLIDFDTVIKGNIATQLLVGPDDIGRRKTRVVGAALEGIGLKTRIVERAFDATFTRSPMPSPPATSRASHLRVSTMSPHAASSKARASTASLTLASAPVRSSTSTCSCTPSRPSNPPRPPFRSPPSPPALKPAYESEIARQVKGGIEESAARCGLLDLAGVTVGAAFVGTFASTVVVADILRLLHGGENYSVIALDLRAPNQLTAVLNTKPGAGPPPPYTAASWATDPLGTRRVPVPEVRW